MQTKLHSLVEAVTSIAIGFCISLLVQLLIFPWYDIEISMTAHIDIVTIFTVTSIVRTYYVRRLFNWINRKFYPVDNLKTE